MLIRKSALFIALFLVFAFVRKPAKSGPAVLTVEGLVTVDGKPVSAEVEINSIIKSKSFKVKTDTYPTEGNFESSLPSGDEYEIIVKVDRFPQQVITLNTSHLDSSRVLNVFADFTSPEYDKKLEELIRSTNEATEASKKNFDKRTFSIYFGALKNTDLVYKVQVAAYKFYENFNYTNVMGLPKIIRKTDNDQITRFTMGNFATYNDALALLKTVQKNNLKDAFVVALYKGEKKSLKQLVDEKILY